MGSWRVKTNRLGFREDLELPVTKPQNEYRVFIVGGSTVFGWGTDSHESIPYGIQKNIQESFPSKQIKIINAGVPWYASWHEISLIIFRILPLSPDLIVVMDGLNDTAFGLSPTWLPLYEGYVDLPTKLSYERRKSSRTLASTALNVVQLSPTLSYFMARLAQKKQTQTGVYHPEVWDQYVSLMSDLKRLLDSKKIGFKIFYQPVMAVEKPLEYFEKTHDGTSLQNPEFKENFVKLYLEGESKLLSSALPMTSLKSLFSETKETIYLDGLHYNAVGNQKIANRITHDLLPLLKSETR
jgi:lysophospholipase L1-like esterase